MSAAPRAATGRSEAAGAMNVVIRTGYHARMDSSRAQLITNYTDGSEGYRDWWAPVLDQLAGPALDALSIPAGVPRILDLGCGTGMASRRLAPRLPADARLVAGDLVQAMLAVARRLAPKIPIVQFDAARLPFPDRTFDLVVCTFALHHIREQRRTLSEAHRILKPGGRLLVITWGADKSYCPAETAWGDMLTEVGGAVDIPEPASEWHEEINTPAAFESMLTSLGFHPEFLTQSTGAYDYTPESLAGVMLGLGIARRRFMALTPTVRTRFEARARRLLAGLPATDFIYRPGIVTALVSKPAEENVLVTGGPSGAADADFRTVCPNCGAEMYDRGCKTRCPQCHFFTDCSDPW